MKLLDKDTIRYQKNLEKKLEIDQGMQLSKSIDLLRHEEAKEKKNLESYREQSLKRIFSDIQNLSIERASIESELIALREEREKLKQPLDEEWGRVTRELNVIAHEKEEIEKTKLSLLEDSQRIQGIEKMALSNLSVSEEERSRAEEKEHKASSLLKQAQEELANAQEKTARSERDINARLVVLERKEKRVSERELECQSIISTYKAKLKDLERLSKRYGS